MKNITSGSNSQFVNRKPLFAAIFTLLMVFFAPLAMNGQNRATKTVCDGTATNSQLPVYGYSGDTQGTTDEFVIPATTTGMSDIANSKISAMTFDVSSVAGAAWTATFQVYMKEIPETTISGTTGPNSCTVVYEGTLDATGATMTVSFDNNFTYTGGNLLIGTYVKTSGNWKSASFYGVSASGAGYQSSGYDNNGAINFIPKTTFTYEKITTPIVSLPATATVLTGFTETLTATTMNVTGTPTITYTSSNTNVATVSGSGTTATVTAVSAGTATITATMTYNNNTYTATCAITVEDPSYCTPSYSNTSDYIKSFVTTGGTTNINNTNTGQGTGGYSDFYNSHSASIGDGETLSFTVTRGYSDSYKYAIWVDWNHDYVFDVNTETMAQQTTSVSSDWSSSFTIPVGTAAGDYRMRVEMLYGSSRTLDPCVSASYGEVEDYKLTVLSVACPKPTNLSLTASVNTVTATWSGTASSYNIDINGVVDYDVTSPHTFTGNLATTYTIKIQADCGTDGTSDWTASQSVTTDLCLAEYMCEIKYRLIDEEGDGWEGNAINVVDDATGVVLATLTVDDGAYATGTLALCDDRDISFVWVSGTDDYETSYTVIDAWGEEIFSGSGAMASTFNYTMQCPSCHTPSNPALSNITTNTVSVAWGPAGDYEVRYRPVQDPIFFDDFEAGLSGDWTIVDSDGDGYEWYESNNNAYSGTTCMTSASWQSGVGALTPDNWLISPQVQLGGYVSFWAVGQDPAWPLEHFAIYVSTTGTDPANFTQVSEEFLAYGEYTRYTADLSSYSGMGYIAIRHFNVSNMFRLNIDDFGVYANVPWLELSTAQPSVDLANLTATTEYELQVRKDCDGEYSFWSEALVFTTPCNVNAGFPWSEDFEGLSTDYTIPDCWDNKESTCLSSTYKWSYENSMTNGTGHNDSKCIRYDSYNSSGQTNMLKTPLLDLETVPIATLKFWYKNEYGGNFSVYVSTNGGVTYSNALATGLNASSWTECTYDLTSYCGHNNVVIVFKGTSNESGYIYLDDVSVTAPRTVVVSGEPACTGKETTLTAVTGAFSNPYFTWSASPSEGAGLPADLTTSEITVTPTVAGAFTYTCSVTEGGAGEATVDDIELTMLQTPTASIEGTNPLPVCVFTQVTLNASGAGDGGSYAWDNELGSGASKTITVTEAKNYTVTVTDANTCTAEATKSVTLKIPGNLPSTYSPEPGIIWTGYESTDWDDQRNWLFFNGDNYTPIVEDLDSTLSVVLRTGGTEQCIMHDPVINNPEFDANAGMTVRRNISVANGTELNIGGALTLEGGTLTLGGSTYLAVGDTVLIADGATVSFSASDTLVVSGNFTLSGNINFVDQGMTDNEESVDDPTDALVIGGDLTINGASTFSPAGGSIVFARNSGNRRVYNNTGRPLEFFKVELDDERTRSGVPHTVFPDGTIIKYTAIFSYGIWDGDLIFAKTGNALVKGGFESYASGNITKIGKNKSFSFPTGGNDVLGSIAAKIPTDVQVSAKFNSKTGGYDQEHDGYPRWWNNNDMCDGSKDLDHVSNYEYWTVRANTTTTLTDLTFTAEAADRSSHFNPASSEDEAVNEEAIRLAMYNGCWKNLGGADNVIVDDGKIEIEIPALSLVASGAKGIADDPIITLGSTTKTTVLPIELTSITATCDGHSALVEWSTASERNNDYFSLERSDDAINFTEIARVAGAGNSIEPLDYSYTDYVIHGGNNYYRLVQVDYDGTRTASEIVVANCVESAIDGEPEVMAYPNPFNGELTLVLDNFSNRAATIEVYDMLGKLIYTEKASAPQNSYETILNLSNLPSGAYTVRVSTTDFVINKNVVKN